jgi:hypothetical protein
MESTNQFFEEDKKLTEWENEPTLLDLKHDLEEAKPSHDAQVTRINNWLDNLYVRGNAKVNTPKGRSKYVPKLIRKQAEWRYPALSEPFLSSPDIFDVQPVSWEDRKAAQQNGLILNNQFNTKIKRTRFIDEYVRTCVDEGTVIVFTGWEYEEESVLEEAPVVEFSPDPSMAPIMQEIAQVKQANPTQYRNEVPEELKQALEMSMESGIPMRPTVVGTETIEVIKVVKNQPVVEVCENQNIIEDPSCGGDLDKAGFVVRTFESSVAALEKTGKYKNLDKIVKGQNSPLSEPDHETNTPDNFNFRDEPRKKFVVYEYWGFWDIDGDGSLTPIVAAWVGNTLIRMEENPFPDKKLPFVAVQYLPVRKEVRGEPDGELLEDNQRVTGALTRGMLDVMGRSANGQTGMRKDMLDAVNRRRYEKGQDYEFNPTADPRQGIHMHTYPEIPQSVPLLIQAQNQEAESLTGVKAYNTGITGQALGDVAAGVRGALDASSKRELGILRRLGEGMTEIGRKIIAMNAEFLEEEEVIRVTNDEFVAISKDDLAGNFDLRLTISTAEEDSQKAQEIGFQLQTMGQSLPFEMTKMLLAEQARLRKMPDLAKKLEDFQPQPDPIEQQIKQLEMAKLQAEVQALQAKAMEHQANAQLDSAKAENLVSDTDLKNLDFVEQESGVKQERELQKQKAQAMGNIELEKTKAYLNSGKS